jgi:hypothetical protein
MHPQVRSCTSFPLLMLLVALALAFFKGTTPTNQKLMQTLEAKRKDWNLDSRQLARASQEIATDLGLSTVVPDELRLFLYAKGVGSDLWSSERNKTFHVMAAELSVQRSLSGRLMRSSEDIILDQATIDRFVGKKESPGDRTRWLLEPEISGPVVRSVPEEVSWVFFRDEVPNSYVERVQHSGLCALHASIVLQHYLVQRSIRNTTGMVDLAAFLRQHADVELLRSFIFRDESGLSAEEALGKFLEISSELYRVFPFDVAPRHFHNSGPALVTCERLRQEVEDGDEWEYTGKPTGKVLPAGHAMVAVGYTKASDFLLQNWWGNKLFLKMDRRYLADSGCVFVFVSTPQSAIPSKFKLNFASHVQF